MSKSRINQDIVWVAQGIEGYGILSAIFGLADQVREHGGRVRILALSEGPVLDYAREHGYECVCLGFDGGVIVKSGGFRRLWSVCQIGWSMVMKVYRVAQWLRREKPAYLHIVPNILAVPGALAAKLAGVQPIWEMSNCVGNTYPMQLNKRFYQLGCRVGGCVVLANSRYSGETVQGMGVWPVTFYLGVDAERFNPDLVQSIPRSELGLEQDDFIVGIFARLTAQKGQLQLVKALAELKESCPKLKLLLLGGPLDCSYAEEIREHVAEHGLGDRVLLLGPKSDVERYYGLLDVGANLRPDPEPFGLSVIEAMMMGIPVLAHGLGGPSETILHEETGWLLEELSPLTIADTLKRVYDNRPLINEMGLAARKHALGLYSTRAEHVRYLEILGK